MSAAAVSPTKAWAKSDLAGTGTDPAKLNKPSTACLFFACLKKPRKIFDDELNQPRGALSP